MEIVKETLPRGVFKFTATTAVTEIAAVREEVLLEVAKNAKVPGFRQGKAPTGLVKDTVDENKIASEVLNHLIPKILTKIQKTDPLEIINQPKIKIVAFEDNKPLVVEIVLITTPKVTLGDWKKVLADKKLDKKEDALEVVAETAQVELAEELVAGERDRMLGRLLKQLETLSLQVDAYVKSQNKTIEDLKKDYLIQAEKSLKMHFVLEELVKEEKIEVSESDIEAAIAAAPDKKAKEALAQSEQKWYIRSILARNKALEKIYAHVNPNRN